MITVIVKFKILNEFDADILKKNSLKHLHYIKMLLVLEERIKSLILRKILLVEYILLIVCRMLAKGWKRK